MLPLGVWYRIDHTMGISSILLIVFGLMNHNNVFVYNRAYEHFKKHFIRDLDNFYLISFKVINKCKYSTQSTDVHSSISS